MPGIQNTPRTHVARTGRADKRLPRCHGDAVPLHLPGAPLGGSASARGGQQERGSTASQKYARRSLFPCMQRPHAIGTFVCSSEKPISWHASCGHHARRLLRGWNTAVINKHEVRIMLGMALQMEQTYVHIAHATTKTKGSPITASTRVSTARDRRLFAECCWVATNTHDRAACPAWESTCQH